MVHNPMARVSFALCEKSNEWLELSEQGTTTPQVVIG
jgi:hypothetical protein